MMLAILVYHIIVQFPQLQKLIKWNFKKNQALIVKISNFMKTRKAKNCPVAIEDVNQTSQTTPVVISASVLREPPLESGTIELYHINPPSVPT